MYFHQKYHIMITTDGLKIDQRKKLFWTNPSDDGKGDYRPISKEATAFYCGVIQTASQCRCAQVRSMSWPNTQAYNKWQNINET